MHAMIIIQILCSMLKEIAKGVSCRQVLEDKTGYWVTWVVANQPFVLYKTLRTQKCHCKGNEIQESLRFRLREIQIQKCKYRICSG